MNTDELARHLQQLFSEKLKLSFGLDVFKDALGQLDQIEIDDLSTYAESLVKFSSDDSVIRKMLEAVCSEKECGAQLTELLQRWNGIFPDNPVPVPTPEVLASSNKGLVAATVVLGVLSASLLAMGIGYAVHRKNAGNLCAEDHFRHNVDAISVGTVTENLRRNTRNPLEWLDLARDSRMNTSGLNSTVTEDLHRDTGDPLEWLDLAQDSRTNTGLPKDAGIMAEQGVNTENLTESRGSGPSEAGDLDESPDSNLSNCLIKELLRSERER